MILPARQIHLHLAEDGVFFVGPLDKTAYYKRIKECSRVDQQLIYKHGEKDVCRSFADHDIRFPGSILKGSFLCHRSFYINLRPFQPMCYQRSY